MSDDIKPALSLDGWEKVRDLDLLPALADQIAFRTHYTTHGVAALCLYGQPFGFTQEDVTALRAFIASAREYIGPPERQTEWTRRADVLDSIADRIASLLPPVTP